MFSLLKGHQDCPARRQAPACPHRRSRSHRDADRLAPAGPRFSPPVRRVGHGLPQSVGPDAAGVGRAARPPGWPHPRF
eukprot:8286176-Alexandrium_andersonii.AAC.1